MASVGCAPVDQPSPPEQRSNALTAGTPDAGDAAVVAIMFADHAACTGVLVAPRVVLTAAHCLVVHSAMPRVLFGSDAASPLAIIDVGDIFVHADFSPLSRAHDLAALVLQQDAPLGASPFAVAGRSEDAPTTAGSSVRLVGFGHDSDQPPAGAPHVKRQGTATITNLATDVITLAPTPSQACLGDSGGPVLAGTSDGGEVLVGLVLGGVTSCLDAATALRADAYADSFITPVIVATAAATRGGGETTGEGGGCSVVGRSPAVWSMWPVALLVLAAVPRSIRRVTDRSPRV